MLAADAGRMGIQWGKLGMRGVAEAVQQGTTGDRGSWFLRSDGQPFHNPIREELPIRQLFPWQETIASCRCDRDELRGRHGVEPVLPWFRHGGW